VPELSAHARRVPLVLVLVATIIAAISALVSSRTTSSSRTPPANDDLRRALAIVDTTAVAATFPTASVELARLRAALPHTGFRVLANPYGQSAIGTIGIYVLPRALWLRQAQRNSAAEVFQALTGDGLRTYGPQQVRDGVVGDGLFDQPLSPSWTVQRGPIASVTRDPLVRYLAPASLRATGTGQPGASATTVTKSVVFARTAPIGTRYLLALYARSQRLSRPLEIDLRLNYRHSYQFFFGVSLYNGVLAPGVPAGTTSRWVPITVTAIAARPVRSIDIFLVNTGLQPLRGVAWLDYVVLRTSESPAPRVAQARRRISSAKRGAHTR